MNTFAKIAGGIGLVILLTSPFTFLFTGSRDAALIKAGIGLTLIAFYVATHWKKLTGKEKLAGSMTQRGRSGFFYSSSALMGVVLVAVLAGINFIVAKRGQTWDLTKKKIYSLSAQTTQTLNDLKEPVKAMAFIKTDNPMYEYSERLFKRYAAESDKFQYEFKNPDQSPKLNAKFAIKQGQTAVVLVSGTEPNQTHTTISAPTEQELTNGLIKITQVGQQKVYYLLGHGEWPLEDTGAAPADQRDVTVASEFKSSLVQDGYAPEAINLLEKGELPKDAAAVVIAGAKTPFSQAELGLLDQYLEQGGRLVYLADESADPGIAPLLAKYGITIEPGMVMDPRNNPQSPFVVATPVFGDHEITALLKKMRVMVQLPYTRAFGMLKQGTLSGVTTTPLVLTLPTAWVETNPAEGATLDMGEKAGSVPVAIIASRDTKAAREKRFDEARIVALGSSLLIVNASWGNEANRNLVLNVMAWASTQVNKITIRPPDRDISTIDMNPELMNKIRFLSADAWPVLLIGFGLAIWVSRRNK
jgi:ABC-type uncharacterized transport system involved in gliding motility auxiliary subunit